MSYLLDSSTVSLLLGGDRDPEVVERHEREADAGTEFAMCPVVAYEIRRGLERRAADRQHRHVVVHDALQRLALGQQLRNIGFGVFSAVDGERTLTLALEQPPRLQVLQRIAHRVRRLLFHPLGVLVNESPLLVVEGVVVHQIVPQYGAAVVVTEGQHELRSLEAKPGVHFRVEPLVDRLGYAHVVSGGQDHALATWLLQRQRLHPQVMDLTVWSALGPVAGQPHRRARRNDTTADTDLPGHFVTPPRGGGPADDEREGH